MFNANFNVILNDEGEKPSFEYSEWNLIKIRLRY